MPADCGQKTVTATSSTPKKKPVECSLDAVGPLQKSILVFVMMDVPGHIRSHPKLHVAWQHVDPVGVSEADELQKQI